MYNMQTSMRLEGGRVDERKDYGRAFTSARLNCGIQKKQKPTTKK